MPIMAVQDQNDARGAARVLARTARGCVDRVDYAPAEKVALNSVFRLLNAYRAHRLAGYEYQRPAPRSADPLAILPASERHIPELRIALHQAIEEIYAGVDENVAIEAIEAVLRQVARRVRPEDEAVRLTSAFLERFEQRLHAAA